MKNKRDEERLKLIYIRNEHNKNKIREKRFYNSIINSNLIRREDFSLLEFSLFI